MRLAVSLALASVVALATPPAAADTDHEAQIWNALLTTVATGERTPSLWFDMHARRGDGLTLIVRPGLGWRATPWLSLWAGYAWIPFFIDGADRRDEHRSWQQAIVTRTAGPVALQIRTRFEQRFGDGDDVGLRLRQFVRAGWTPACSPVGLVAWDELFIGFNDVDWGPRAGYDQNRLFLGAAFPVAPWGRFEAGYLLVHLNRDTDQAVHALAINLFLTVAP